MRFTFSQAEVAPARGQLPLKFTDFKTSRPRFHRMGFYPWGIHEFALTVFSQESGSSRLSKFKPLELVGFWCWSADRAWLVEEAVFLSVVLIDTVN